MGHAACSKQEETTLQEGADSRWGFPNAKHCCMKLKVKVWGLGKGFIKRQAMLLRGPAMFGNPLVDFSSLANETNHFLACKTKRL